MEEQDNSGAQVVELLLGGMNRGSTSYRGKRPRLN